MVFKRSPPKINGFIGLRSLGCKENINDDEDRILFRETYVFDKMGKLIKIYNKDEMGQNLKLFDEGSKGISEFNYSEWDDKPIDFYRYHDFENSTFLILIHLIFLIFLKNILIVRSFYFIDIKESYINMVYNIHNKENTYINLMIDVKNRLGYFKAFQIKSFQGFSMEIFKET
ncbi:MAG: hypothetical protein IPL63_00765 [Saprospiraceae bacterium]|nr:hypothetical protein [Saprospiraceae bacterium]